METVSERQERNPVSEGVDASAVRGDDAGDCLQERRFPGTVLPNDSDDLAFS